MSTRCNIAIKSQDKEGYDYIYCHFDGGAYVQKVLNEHYTDEAKIRALISLGSISKLAPRVSPDATEKHSFETPVKDVVVAYHRDRGEPLEYTSTRYTDTFESLVAESRHDMVDYLHIYEDGKWLIRRMFG